MILPILYPDLVALARVVMAQSDHKRLVENICDKAHQKGWSIEDATYDCPKVEGFSLNCNRGLGALAQTALAVLEWRRKNNLP